MSKIQNMRVVSDDPELLHLNSFEPVAIGTIEEVNGKKYRVINNYKTVIVTFEPIEGSAT